MFKRLREGLFKRTEEETTDYSVPDEATDTTETSEAMEPASEESWTDAAADIADEDYLPATAVPDETLSTGVVDESSSALESPVEDTALIAEESEPETDEPEKRGFFSNPFKFSLGRTRQIFGRVNQALEHDDITEELWDELEETLISGDVGVQTTEKLMRTLRERAQAEEFTRGRQLRDALKEELEILLGDPEPLVFSETSPISVYLVVGVNGVGKTTSIAKMANLLKREKYRVMLAAGDTFRAAATEQIKTWGDRIGVPVISHQHGADPGAVVYDAMQAAQARGTNVLIVDTAGRLHTKFNLMEELKKIMKVLQKYDPEAPHEVLLVMDATTGQNGFMQAKQFVQDSGVSGVILTKLDGTARGGIVFAVASELGLPIKYVGTGEKLQDIAPFDPVQFVDALFEAE
jgi:fused signal recognition particle receptor